MALPYPSYFTPNLAAHKVKIVSCKTRYACLYTFKSFKIKSFKRSLATQTILWFLLWTLKLDICLIVFFPSATYTSTETIPFLLGAKATTAPLQNCCLILSLFNYSSSWIFSSNDQLPTHWMQTIIKANSKLLMNRGDMFIFCIILLVKKRGNIHNLYVTLLS